VRLKLLRGVMGDGVRTELSVFKSAVELIQIVCKASVVHGEGGFWLVVVSVLRPLHTHLRPKNVYQRRPNFYVSCGVFVGGRRNGWRSRRRRHS